ncbi:MAG: hypothetical protein PHD05_00850 [Sphaerochaetaceae bacterium]|nr:hypothetical protein [Sphaerochaetaceae bacterium]
MLNISDYVSKATSWAKETTANVTSSVIKTAQNVKSKAESSMQEFLEETTSINQQQPIKMSPKTFGEKDVDLFFIGRTCRFSPHIDKQHRFSNYLRNKMSVVDLIPVDYKIDFRKFWEMVQGKTNAPDTKAKEIGNIFTVQYSENIAVFKRICEHHGLDNKYVGLRLYTTDESTANDNIQIDYKDSSFKGIMDPLVEFGQSARDFAHSLAGSEFKNFTDDLTGLSVDTAGKLADKFNVNAGLKNIMENVAAIGSDIILKGNKMTFPKIWQETTYTNSMSLNIKLISPYGHPAAVKEFIIKPLSYLIILSAPQTLNGVTYGGNIPLTIKAYGMNHTVVGSIRSMTFRRGGSETSFNLFKQPLSIDVSIEFQTLFDAFAVFDPGSGGGLSIKTDKDVFGDPELSNTQPTNVYSAQNTNTMLTSLGIILNSLKPVFAIEMSIDPQIYGSFIPPQRDDIPRDPAFNPIAGNLGSTIDNAVAKIDNFGNMIMNAPQIIQQGLANAVYNVSKEAVGNISGTVSDWINKPIDVIDDVQTTIMGNIF